MKQIIPFDLSKGGSTPLLCLANTCKGFNIPNLYRSAWQAWLNTEQHAEQPPQGLDVPVYFSYTVTIDGVRENYGHIGVRMFDGRFWSDGRIFSSLEAYTSTPGRPVYVGWGESINEVKIIEVKMEDLLNNGDLVNYFDSIYGSKPTEADLDFWLGEDRKHPKTHKEFCYGKFMPETTRLRKSQQAQYTPYTGKQLYTKKG